MYQSPGFSSFRSLMSNWDDYCFWESVQDNVKNLIDGQGLIMFFTKDGDVFGTPEEGRMMFARMKQPDEDTDPDWVGDAGFMAVNLCQALGGGGQHVMFGKKDLKKIKIVDRDEAEKTVMGRIRDDDAKAPSGHPLRMLFAKMIQIIPKQFSPEDGGLGMIKLKDKE